MKKTLAAAVVGAALTVGVLGGAGAANASSGSFINAVNNYGWHETVSGATLNLGYRTCERLNAGWSFHEVVDYVYYNTDAGTSWATSHDFVSMADSYLC
jgi:hypothetical protein